MSDNAGHRTGAALKLLIPLLLLYSTSYFQRTALPGTIFNDLQQDLGLSAVGIAAVGSAFIYAYSLPQLLAGMLIDRYCGSRVVLAGGIIFLAGVLTQPFAGSLTALCLCRIITGLGASTMYLSIVQEADRLFDRKYYATLIGITYFIGYGGGLCGKLPFALACERFGWQQVLLAAGVLSLILYLWFAGAALRSPMPEISRQKFSFAPLVHIFKNPLSYLVCFCSTVNFSIYFTIQTVFGEKFLMDFTGLSLAWASGTTFMMTLLCMFALLSTGFLVKLTGKRRRPLVILAAAVCLLNCLLMLTGITLALPWWYFVAVYLCFAVSAGSTPIFMIIMQEVNTRDGMTQATGICNLCCYLPVAVFAPVSGAILNHFGGALNDSGVFIYSATGYLVIFASVSVISAISFLLSFLTPETKGHYLHLHS